MESKHSYHATQALPVSEKSEYEQKARRQEDTILSFFRSNPGSAFSPEQIHSLLHLGCPLTSVRRAITNLTSEGQLMQTGQLIEGLYGRPVGTWRAVQKVVRQLGLFE